MMAGFMPFSFPSKFTNKEYQLPNINLVTLSTFISEQVTNL